MIYEFLKEERIDGGVAILTISSPRTLNALNSKILGELDQYVDNIDCASTKVLIITGEGKSFVAGADISQMSEFDSSKAYEFSKFGASVFKKIEDLEMPVIGAINGFALGGGCELALSCDLRIASENASFGQPEVKLGIIPGFSGTYRLSKIVGQTFAKELIYTGKRISASEAYRIGLVNSVVPIDKLIETALEMASNILTSAPIAVRFAKECINRNYDLNCDEAILLENKYFSVCFDTLDRTEGMEAFLTKRNANFKNK